MQQQHLPTWNEVLHFCIRDYHLIEKFKNECACSVIFHQLPDLVNNHRELKGAERVTIDLLIDYIMNFIYMPILYTNDFRHQQSSKIFKDF